MQITDLNSKKQKILLFTILMIVIFISHLNEGLWEFGDDIYFKDAINTIGNGSLIEYLKFRYKTWSGRIIVEAIMVSIINYEFIWRVLNSIMMCILIYSMYKFVKSSSLDNDYEEYILLFKLCTLLSIFLIDKEVYKWSISWVTGSFNYLWPMSLGLFSLIPFKQAIFNESYSKKLYIMYFLSTVVACNTEQVAAFTICFAIISNLWIYIRYKKIDIILILHNIFMIMIALVLFLSPGNVVRYNAEVLNWYPNFDMLTSLEKIYRGLVLLIYHLFNNYIVVIFIMCLIIAILIYDKYKSRLIRFVSILPLASIAIYYMILKNYISPLPSQIIDYENLINFNFKTYFSTGMFLSVLIIIPYLIYLILDDIDNRMMVIILYFASLCCTLVMSFSPTIYASGARVFFSTDIIILIIMCILLREVIFNRQLHIKLLSDIIMSVLLLLSFANYIIFIFDK